MAIRCYNCGSESFQHRAVELLTQVGDAKIVDRTSSRPVCTQCGAYTIPSELAEVVELRAAVVLLSELKPAPGAVIKFARKALDLTQAALAEKIGTTPESICRWEKENPSPEMWVGLAIEGLVLERLHPRPPEVRLLKKAC